MTRLATTPGLFPLPDWAKTRLTEEKGRQKSDLISGDESADVTDIYDRARREVIERQRAAGLDRLVEGQLRWDDMLAHPLTVHDAVEIGGLLRYYDNNNFYREPTVTGDLTPDGDVGAELVAAADQVDGVPLQAVLPGPSTLFDLATDGYYGDPAVFLTAIAEFLAAEIEAFPPVDTLFLLDPALAVNPPETETAVAAVETVTAALDSAPTDVVVHPYWGTPPDAVYTGLLDADVGLGFDLVTAPEAVQAQVAEYGAPATVALGVVDGQNTRLEALDEIDQSVAAFEAAAGTADTTYLTTNTPPFYLPVNRFEDKLDRLARAASPRELHP